MQDLLRPDSDDLPLRADQNQQIFIPGLSEKVWGRREHRGIGLVFAYTGQRLSPLCGDREEDSSYQG